jgi:hypothetical protein
LEEFHLLVGAIHVFFDFLVKKRVVFLNRLMFTAYFFSVFTMFFMSGFLGMVGYLASGPLTPVLDYSLTVVHRFLEVSRAFFLSSHEPLMGMSSRSILHTLKRGSPCVVASRMAVKSSWR